MENTSKDRANSTIAFMLAKLVNNDFIVNGLCFEPISSILSGQAVEAIRKSYNTALARASAYMLETFSEDQITNLYLKLDESIDPENMIFEQIDYDLSVAVQIENYLTLVDNDPMLRWVKADPAKWVAFKNYINFAYRSITCELSMRVNQFDDYIKQIYPLVNEFQSSAFYFDVLVHDQIELFKMKREGELNATVTVSFSGEKAISTWVGSQPFDQERKRFSVRL